MPKLTKRLVDSLPLPSSGDTVVWDDEVIGLGVRVYGSGRKIFLLRYRVGSKQRFLSLGVVGSPLTLDEARARARRALQSVADGRDPQSDKIARRVSMTVGDLIDIYLKDGPISKPSKRESSWQTDASNLNRHVRPLLGQQIANDVTAEDVGRMRNDIEKGRTRIDQKVGPRARVIVRGGTGIASRAVSVLQAAYTWGQQNSIVTANPAKGVARAKAKKMERFLSSGEVFKLFEKLENLAEEKRLPAAYADLIRLLLFTGARRGELVSLRWSEVDVERRFIVLPADRHKTGSKTGTKRIPLAPICVELISRQPRLNEYVFNSIGKSAPSPTSPDRISKLWRDVRAAAELGDLRLHDLRHSFASFSVAGGESLFLVGRVLGHTNAVMTERYAHLADAPLIEAASRTAQAIQTAAANQISPATNAVSFIESRRTELT